MKSNLKKQCDELWRLCIMEMFGWESGLSNTPAELSPKSGKLIGLQAHHIAGKSNYLLRYSLDNGIALTTQEHIYGVHNSDPSIAREYQDKIIEFIGKRRWNKLIKMKHKTEKINLVEMKEFLENKLNELRNG